MYTQARDHPSFSSSLLDQIYRSIDVRDHHKPIVYNKITTEKQSRNVNSISNSSDSSTGGGFSSSEAESVYGGSSRSKPNSIRKENLINTYGGMHQFEDLQLKQKHEGKLVKTKSRAMKIYGDLKKVKQPISPGGRLSTFLNSLFNSGNSKNAKLSSFSANGSTCSSASSFSRSCLSKTPSSRGKSGNNCQPRGHRSVRFVPVSVSCQPRGHISLYGDESNDLHALKFVKNRSNEEFRVCSSEKTYRTEEASRNFLRNYQKKTECQFDLIKGHDEIDLNFEVYDDDDDDDDDDDAASHVSSDLFELENFSAIGMENYGDELPVFETTHMNKNLAIGNGYFM